MDGAPVGAESLWPSVIQWKLMFSNNWKNIKNHPGGGGTNGCLKKKVFLKNQKHQPNIVEKHTCALCTRFTLV
jgi:hypothetical protein